LREIVELGVDLQPTPNSTISLTERRWRERRHSKATSE